MFSNSVCSFHDHWRRIPIRRCLNEYLSHLIKKVDTINWRQHSSFKRFFSNSSRYAYLEISATCVLIWHSYIPTYIITYTASLHTLSPVKWEISVNIINTHQSIIASKYRMELFHLRPWELILIKWYFRLQYFWATSMAYYAFHCTRNIEQ